MPSFDFVLDPWKYGSESLTSSNASGIFTGSKNAKAGMCLSVSVGKVYLSAMCTCRQSDCRQSVSVGKVYLSAKRLSAKRRRQSECRQNDRRQSDCDPI
ncbi:hypothetical protein I4U23_021795 [Adineta vaga]|nr:hypothetical protein I4U23_021795 [Adineta vaga]